MDINRLLADKVGLGKTHQIVSHLCIVHYFQDYYAVHKKFPGAFSEHILYSSSVLQFILCSKYEVAWTRGQYS